MKSSDGETESTSEASSCLPVWRGERLRDAVGPADGVEGDAWSPDTFSDLAQYTQELK